MIQIKIFKNNTSDKTVNKFLLKNGGKIVDYNPIIVEYEIDDNIELPSVTLSGIPSTIQMSRENCDTSYMVEINFNRVLFFGSKILFLSGLNEVAKFDFNRKLLINKDGLNLISNIYISDSDYAKPFISTDTSPFRLVNSLQELGLSISDSHIAYDKRNNIFKDISLNINKLGNDINYGLNNVANATVQASYINSEMNRKLHNSKGIKVR